MKNNLISNDKLGLYIHIPFCHSLCSYCDFSKTTDKRCDTIYKYFDSLFKEIESKKSICKNVDTIYIGGGTPNSISYFLQKKLLKKLSVYNPSEFTIEINPELYTVRQGNLYKEFGVSRISIGVQTFQPLLLNILNRNHDKQIVKRTISSLKKLGFININIDMIYGIPGQTIPDVLMDLKYLLDLNPTHISYYNLILEEDTQLYYNVQTDKMQLISNELEYKMNKTIISKLKRNNYIHYEISNFAKKGYESIHNTKYWTLQNYLGFGLGACSFIGNNRIENTKSLIQYSNNSQPTIIPQNTNMNIQDELIFGLRLIKGVNVKKINNKYNVDIIMMYPTINLRIKEGLLIYNKGYLRLSRKGYYFGNRVFEDFI